MRMRTYYAKQTARCLLVAGAWLLLGSTARAQESVLVVCFEQGGCTYQRAYSVKMQGNDSVKLVPPSAAKNADALRRGRSTRINTLEGIYREPQSGMLRILTGRGELGDIVLPSKLPQGAATAAAAVAASTFEFQKQAKSGTATSVTIGQFVALLAGPRLQGSVVDFLKREVAASEPHPQRAALLAQGIAFANGSAELQAWRGELRNTMQRSLETFKGGTTDPSRLEATLDEGLAAMAIYRLIAADGEKEEALQTGLTAEHDLLLERFAIAGALKNAGLHDPFLEKLGQIGMARWSRADLMANVEQSLRASADAHSQRAGEFLKNTRFAQAFDEARLASSLAPCDTAIGDLYRLARLQFVNQTMIQALPEYSGQNRISLEQIVRELQGIDPTAMTPEHKDLIQHRIKDGEALDNRYLPLQLKKAEFLMNIGQATDARMVITDVERHAQLDRQEADKWLALDGRIETQISTMRQRIEKLTREQIANELFEAALKSAAAGLQADPGNLRLLYVAAVAAAVQRDYVQARQFVQRYLGTTALPCTGDQDVKKSLFEMYRAEAPSAVTDRAAVGTPNWMSGESYAPGVFYDPLSGSFQQHVAVSAVENADRGMTSTEFRWDRVMLTSITTSVTSAPNQPARRQSTVLYVEPVYDQKHVYMKAVATAGSTSASARREAALRFLNCPDFDPLLAAKFTGKVSTRGWAGNPFFHPFLWDDVYLFNLEYDELGRIKTATPVTDGVSRPTSTLSEPLTFVWEGNSRKLLAIQGTRYRRVMHYDGAGRLTDEKITHPQGDGKIEYEYRGNSMQLVRAICEDSFYDKARRVISFEERER